MVGLMASFDVARSHNQQKHLILQSKLRAIYLMENNFDISNYNENSKFTPTPRLCSIVPRYETKHCRVFGLTERYAVTRYIVATKNRIVKPNISGN